jgi:flagellar biosynthesis protein FliR
MTDLVPLLTELSGMGADMFWTGLLVFLRVGAAMASLPAFGEQSVPQRVRLVLAFAFTAVVAPAVGRLPDPENGVILPCAVEVVIGVSLGLALRLFVLALQVAGAIAAQATSLSQLFGGVGPEPQPAIANLLVMAGLALAVSMGLHVHIAEFLILSYQILPAGGFPGADDMAQWGLGQISRAFTLGFVLATPFTIAALLYNMALGVINRAMPALMVSFVGAPALTAAGLALMAVMAPLALVVWSQALQVFLAAPFVVVP